MKYFYDCEFIEDGRTIDLISIGIVAEDGREFYAVSNEFSEHRLLANEWLRDNVWPSLPTRPCAAGCRCTSKGAGHLDTDDPDVRTRAQIANAVRRFILADDSEVSLWADYAAYDHVALAQLYGTMMDLPGGFPMFTSDIQQEAERLGIHAHHLPQQAEGEHNALADARHARDRWRFLSERPETAAALAHKERYRPVEPAGVLLDAETGEPAKDFDPKRTYVYDVPDSR